MSEAKWTAGPWSIVRYGDGSSLVIHSDTDNRVCFMATASSDRPTSHAEIRANARLISSAPDLAEALEAFARAAEMFAWPVHEGDTHPIAPGTTLTVGDLRRARAALRKARGEND